LVIFWFTSAIAWASGLSGLKDATSKDKIFSDYPTCANTEVTKCAWGSGATYGAATVSVVSHDLNVFIK